MINETKQRLPATFAARISATSAFAREHLSLVLVLTLFAILIVTKLNRTPYLYALDPWRDVYFTTRAEEQKFFGYTLDVYNGIVEAPYPTFLRSNAYLITLVTGLESFTIFRYGSVFLRLMFVLQIYALVETFTENRRVALLCAVLVFTSPYFVRRSFITFPENLGMLFHLLSVWSLEKYRRLNRWEYLATLGLALTGVLFVHSKSIYFSAFILTAYAVPRLLDKDFRALRDMALCTLGVGIAALPVSVEMVAFVVETVVDNVGQNSEWGVVAREQARYTPPTLLNYQEFIGPAVMLLAILGLVYLIRRGVRQHLHLLLMLLFTFMLSLGPHLHIYVPPDRMQAYLFVPLVLIASLFVADFLMPRLRSYEAQAVAGGMLVLAFLTVAGANPWVGMTEGQFRMADEVNTLLETASDDGPLIGIVGNTGSIVYLIDRLDMTCMTEEFFDFRAGGEEPACGQTQYILTRGFVRIEGYEVYKRATDFYLLRRLN